MAEAAQTALYLVKDHSSGDIKIGISQHPGQRIKDIARQYNVGHVSFVDVVWFEGRETSARLEREFHARYRDKHSPARGGREWFSLNAEEIQGLRQWIAHSTEQRAFRACTLVARAYRPTAEIWQERVCRAFVGVALGGFVTALPVGFISDHLNSGKDALSLWAGVSGAIGLVAGATIRRTITKQQTYGPDGERLSAAIPVVQLKQMQLWQEEVVDLQDLAPMGSREQFPLSLEELS